MVFCGVLYRTVTVTRVTAGIDGLGQVMATVTVTFVKPFTVTGDESSGVEAVQLPVEFR